MLKMDLKFLPITWVENIYQKLEAVCQEVDDIVRQDPVKYVENQVQNAGDTVKKFCSDIVSQDPDKYAENQVQNAGDTVKKSSPDIVSWDPVKYVENQVQNAGDTVNKFCSDIVSQDPVKYVENQVQNAGDTVKKFCSDIVSQDPVKYVENQVQNAGDTVKKFCSDVVQELLSPPLNSMHGACSVALKDNEKSSKSTSGVEEIIQRSEENPVNNVIKSLHDSEATDLANNQQSHTSRQLDQGGQVNDQTSSNAAEMEDLYVPQDGIGDRETSDFLKENLHARIRQNTVKSTPQLLNLVSLDEKKPFESSVWSQYLYGFYDDGCRDLAGRQEKSDLITEQNSVIVDDNSVMSLIGKELFEALFSESSDGIGENTCGILEEVSIATSIGNMKSQCSLKARTVSEVAAAGVECVSDASQSSGSLTSSEVTFSALSSERSLRKIKPLCSESSQISNSQSAKSAGNCSSETESCENNSVDVAGYNFDSSIMLVSSAPTSDAADLIDSKGSLTSSEEAFSALSSESSLRKIKPLCSESSQISNSQCAKSAGNCPFETESFENNSVDVTGYNFDSSIVLVSSAPTSDVADLIDSKGSLTFSEVAFSTLSGEWSLRKIEPLCSQISNSQSAKSAGNCFFETESFENNSVDVAGYNFDSSIMLVSSAPTSDIADLIDSKEGEISSISEVISLNNSSRIRHGEICSTQDTAIISLSDIDETLANSTESSIEDIQLIDNTKLDESCVFVDSSELCAVSFQTPKLRSYKKRIQDAVAPRKRIAKEYEQLAMWYADIDAGPCAFSDGNNSQMQLACDNDWELL